MNKPITTSQFIGSLFGLTSIVLVLIVLPVLGVLV